ncbi:SAM-dependent methyltransferase [Actinophytocola xinjiangensis]|uniref:SAM-dependent methyltransferase n=1 Tax=Actinophytocola xinjiangensis TaxID=485602 RepID=A0A7Z0WQH0_9PSEU|nr:class I SAM-dependent methyltransferase [Actinophytocola xinjiangensis]OLF10606.1 SAM-dependent methyltransferase [Actinophytocola xinjiangensis]
MTVRSNAGYGEHADALATGFEAVTFEDVHREVMPWFPAAPATVLDVGAGSGRDAAALARRGHRVLAVEPTAELRRIAQRLHAGDAIDWLDDHLPDLARVTGTFDLVLLSAVWMHLDATERASGLRRLAGLLAPGSSLIMSLRHGPVPAGRRMFEVTAEETAEVASRCGLRVIHSSERDDLRGRTDVWWSTLVLGAPS